MIMDIIGPIMLILAVVLHFLFGHRFGPRGGKHDPRIKLGAAGFWDVITLMMFVGSLFLCWFL